MQTSPKLCRSCGALMDAGDRVCAGCGAPARAAQGWVQRFLERMLPSFYPASTVLLVLNLLNLGVVLLVFGLSQLFKPESAMLLTMGALDPYSFFQGEYWRIITYGFLHIGLLHIVFNMMALSQVGPVLEREVGSARFLCVYLLSLLGGGAADLLVRGPVIMVIAGASGALFGLIGFGMTFAHFYGGPAGRAQRNFFLQWALYGFLFGFVVRADNICHLGGFITGALLGYIVERERTRHAQLTPVWNTLAIGCGLVTLAAFLWMGWAQR
jgi:rhomboid protease GluP